MKIKQWDLIARTRFDQEELLRGVIIMEELKAINKASAIESINCGTYNGDN